MKKTLKKLITIVVAMAMIVAMAVPAFAYGESVKVYKKQSVTLYPAQSAKNRFISNSWVIGYVGNKKATVKSSNPKVASVETYAECIIETAKKAGKTTISVKADNKTYKCALTVSKYTNPVASVKIGNKTVSGKKFNNSAVLTAKYSQYAGKKTAVKFNLKKGWKLQFVEYAKKTWQRSEEMKNGGKVSVSGGSGFEVIAGVKNTKTGQMETVVVYFK